MTVALKKNVPGFRDANGVFRPIRSASYVGGGSSRRKATAKDRKKYSRAKAGDLGKARQERALEAPWDREHRLKREAEAREKREQDRITRELEREIYGETSGRTSRGKAMSLAQFVRSEGGIRRTFRHGGKAARGKRSSWDSGEIERLSRKESGSSGLTTSDPRRGKTMDGMFQAAREAGYDVADINDLMDRVEAEISTGKKTYSTHGSMTYNPRKTKTAAKKNPDLLGMFANAAVGIASTLQINEMMKSRKRAAAPKKRGTTKAKRRNPVAGKRPTARKNPRSAIRNPRSNQPHLFKRQPKGELYVLTIGSGDDLISVYLHDGDKDGFSKRFKTLAGAKAYATRNKFKLVENPKRNGIIKRAWARSRAASEYRRELRLEAAAERSRKRRQKAEQAARSNPRRSASGKTAVARAAKKAVARSAKANPNSIDWRKIPAGTKILDKGYFQTSSGRLITWSTRDAIEAQRWLRQHAVKAPAKAKARKPKAAAKRRNPKSTARRRTFEMFQGRRVTTARPMLVSNHAPANLDALGDLVELKIAGGPRLTFNGKGTKLCAAGGKLWIAGKRFAKPNPAAKANELNPIGEIDHVVYGTYKPHHGDHDYTHYIHKLGEESGKRPILCVDREGFPVIRGGNYKIEARGIVD